MKRYRLEPGVRPETKFSKQFSKLKINQYLGAEILTLSCALQQYHINVYNVLTGNKLQRDSKKILKIIFGLKCLGNKLDN